LIERDDAEKYKSQPLRFVATKEPIYNIKNQTQNLQLAYKTRQEHLPYSSKHHDPDQQKI
jgi:hypothetical protein